MWLINVDTFALEYYIPDMVQWNYAILSHVWEHDEVSFEDMKPLKRARRKHGWKKIKWTCIQAKKDKLKYAWVDTCCIDKSSSAELQEAINSMYRWYEYAYVCYTYLTDVSCGDFEARDDPKGFWTYADYKDYELPMAIETQVRASKWFTRGWTLQELIAPRHLVFYDHGWNRIGSKQGLKKCISKVTGIPTMVLMDFLHLEEQSMAARMSWAANRRTSRVEDQAYSLLGIFDINMPMLYGEGEKAFVRLQEEIIKTSADHSIFAFPSRPFKYGPQLAHSPDDFKGLGDVVLWTTVTPFERTNRGIRIELPLLQDQSAPDDEFVAALGCLFNDLRTKVLGLRLERTSRTNEYTVRSWWKGQETGDERLPANSRIVNIDVDELSKARLTTILIRDSCSLESYDNENLPQTLWSGARVPRSP